MSMFKNSNHEAVFRALTDSMEVTGEGFVLRIAEIASDAALEQVCDRLVEAGYMAPVTRDQLFAHDKLPTDP